MTQTPLKYDIEVADKGRIELQVPFPKGSKLTVFVVKSPGDTFDDLMSASNSSIEFWDNPLDDEDWNDA